MRAASFLLFGFALTSCLAAASEPRPTRFQFLLENDYSTSAGAFDASGRLIRTLWSNRRFRAGHHDAVWDGRDDDGRPVPGGAEYEIRMLSHNVIYTWDGVIGNTSPDQTSPHHHAGQYFLNDLVVSGDRAFFTTTVEEPVPSMRYFRLDQPQYWHARPALPMTYSANMGLIAADEERVYWAYDASPWKHTWGKGGDQAFVMATDRDISREISFEAGTTTCVRLEGSRCYSDGERDMNIRSAIDIVREFQEDPATPIQEGARNNVTGLAVQREGTLLFVAHGRLNPSRIHVLDKRSGRELARVSLAGVGRLVAGPGRDDLWAIHDSDAGRVVSHLSVGPAPEFELAIVRTLEGIESPITLALAPDGSKIVVADGGSSQQLKAFHAVTGEPVWTYGRPGGYAANGPVVSPDKFSFRRYDVNSTTAGRFEQTVLGMARDGSLWVGDTGLSRLLKLSAERKFLDQIAFLPVNYNAVADRNDPTRVFARYLEYSVDYTKPIGSGWRLMRYYGDGPPIAGGYHAYDAGFVDIATLRNGRTYGLLRARSGVEVMEIPAVGDLQRFPLRLQKPVFMNEGGDLYSVRADASGRAEFSRRRLTGFDESGAPEWGHEESSARVPRTPRDPRVNPYQNTVERCVAELGPDLHVLFDGAKADAHSDAGQFHLAAVSSGQRGWLWRASPATHRFNFAQPDGVFDTSRPWYAGTAMTSIGDHIVYNYHGEGWHNRGQANQFLHWSRNGLFIGQFGVPHVRGVAPGAAGVAGNSFSLQLVRANGATYLWHNDENSHYGLHRWRLDGVEWIRDLAGRGRPGERIELTRNPRTSPGVRESDAPSKLAAKVIGEGIRLTWSNSGRAARSIEVQRLQPTYVGSRFERVAVLSADAETWLDTAPLPGEPTIYRVRTLFSDGASDYSNHVHLTAPAKEVVLESQRFEALPPALRDDFHRQPTPDVEVGVVTDPGNAQNRVLRVRVQKRPKSEELRARVRWTASGQLFRALNESLGKPRGSRPDIYRVQLRLRVLKAQLDASSEASVQVDAGYDAVTFDGRRQSLLDLVADQTDRARRELVDVSFNFTAMANGGGSGGLQQYRAVAPTELSVVFPITLRAEGDVVEFLVDDFSVARLDDPVHLTAGAL